MTSIGPCLLLVVVVALGATEEEFADVPAPAPALDAGGAEPALYPRAVQMLSKNDGGMTGVADELVHGRALHILCARACGVTPGTASYP